MPASIAVSGLQWSAPGQPPLFENLNLTFGAVRTGLVGRNGVGKTTLLKLVTGELPPQAGKVVVSGSLGVLCQTTQTNPRDTVADLFGVRAALDILRRMEQGNASNEELSEADWTLESRVAAALSRVGLAVEPDASLAAMSGGQRTRVSLAALLFAEPAFLLLDEPTNNLDRQGREAVIGLLANWRSGAIVVSHDRELLDTMDAIVELTTLGVTRYGGNGSTYRELKALELAAAQRAVIDAEKRVADVARSAQVTHERQTRRSSAGKKKGAKGGIPRIVLGGMKDRGEKTTGDNANLAQQRQEEARQAAAASRAQIEIRQSLSVKLPPTHLPASKSVLRLEAVSVGYRPTEPILQRLSFSLTGPERVALTGPNGCGKTTLLAVVTGQLRPWHGTVRVIDNFALLDQHMQLLNPSTSIRDNFMRMNPQSSENASRAALARFMFPSAAALQPVATLSGGQLLRAGLACALGGTTPPPLLILDEPTNHLDIDSIEAVERGLQTYDGALLVVSHDEKFLAAIGITRRLELPSSTSPSV